MKSHGIKLGYIFLALFFAVPLSAEAQHHVYHNVGDTIIDQDSIYYYQWWPSDWSDTNNVRISPDYYGHSATIIQQGLWAQYFYTEQPLKIIGLAAVAFSMSPITGDDGVWPRINDSTELPEYLLLYEATPDTFQLLKQVRWKSTDPNRNLKVRSHNIYANSCNELGHWWVVLPRLKEYYFEKAVTVMDSFYVGGTKYSNFTNMSYMEHDDPLDQWVHYAVYSCYDWSITYSCYIPGCDTLPKLLYKYYNTNASWAQDPAYPLFEWRWGRFPYCMFVFPIIEIDTVPYVDTTNYECPNVQNLRIADQSEGYAVAIWSGNGRHSSWQLSYGPSGTAPEDGTILQCNTPSKTLYGLDTTVDYVAYVRALCHINDSNCYSLWSDSVCIHFSNPPDGDSTHIRNALEQFTFLMPNPASSLVQVFSSFNIDRVEVFNIKGQRITEFKTDGFSLSFDVEGWDAGTYIVVIHTGQGYVSKKLIVN